MNSIWVRALPDPMHLGLKMDRCTPRSVTKLKEPYSFTKVPNGSYTYFPDILRVQKEGTQMCMSE